tara:strand:- start:3362 stop:6322 length:2961 start_codon:yes stop_codon:yes gene_type:complete
MATTQLVIYPQNHKGVYSSLGAPGTAVMVPPTFGGSTGSAFNGTPVHDFTGTTGIASLITAFHNYIKPFNTWTTTAVPINEWIRYENSNTGQQPFVVNSNVAPHYFGQPVLRFDEGLSGMGQMLSGLIPTTLYNVSCDLFLGTGSSPGNNNCTVQIDIWEDSGVATSPSLVSTHTENLQPFLTQSPNPVNVSFNFQATSTEQWFTFTFFSTICGASCVPPDNTTLSVLDLNVIAGTIAPGGTIEIIGDGQVIADLYEDESIPLTLSVDNFQNAAEKVQSYSKGFQLPGTDRNNKLFNHLFDITRTCVGTLDFNPHLKTKAILKQDGYDIFEGYLRIINIQQKNGEISYTINLYSSTVALKDFLEDKTLADLPLQELTHPFNLANVQNSYNGSGISYSYGSGASFWTGFRSDTDTIKYPICDWDHSVPVDSDGNPAPDTIGQFFRPWIQVKYLIDLIIDGTPYTYSSAFFDTSDFKKLYMDFNWGDMKEPNAQMHKGIGFNETTLGAVSAATASADGPWQPFVYDNETFSAVTDMGFDISTSTFTAQWDNCQFSIYYKHYLRVDALTGSYLTAGTQVAEAKIEKYDAAGLLVSTYGWANIHVGMAYVNGLHFDVSNSTTIVLNTGESIRPVYRALEDYAVRQERESNMSWTTANMNKLVVNIGTPNITGTQLLSNLRGEIGQWKLLKGVMNLFNLISMPDPNDENNIIFETYTDTFYGNKDDAGTTLADRGIKHDWTEKIDAEEITLEPLTNLKKHTEFKYVEDEDDYCFLQYKQSANGYLYGSKKWTFGGNTLLEGTEEIIAEPFAATIMAPLMPSFGSCILPKLYARSEDGVCSSFDNLPRLLYDCGTYNVIDFSVDFKAQNNSPAQSNVTEFLQFSHTTDVASVVSIPPATTDTIDYNFESHQLLAGMGVAPTRNVFNLYWLPYFSELYNPDTRILKIRINLSAADINSFEFTDKVYIKQRVFRVNKIDYKPGDLAKVELIMID